MDGNEPHRGGWIERTSNVRRIGVPLCLLGFAACTTGVSVGPTSDSAGPYVATSTNEDDSGIHTTGGDGSDSSGSDGLPRTTADSGDAETGSALPCAMNSDCDDDDPCTIDRCEDARCNFTPTCDDGLACTIDHCDPETGSCAYEPDDAQCTDQNACNGAERCDPAQGCIAGSPVACNDDDACTNDSCDPETGMCISDPLECTSGDGCCPVGCTAEADSDCECTNRAADATPSYSDGGSSALGFGPDNFVDGVNETDCANSGCTRCYGWISNGSMAADAFIALEWDAPVTIGAMRVDAADPTPDVCGNNDRIIEDGIVEAWDGESWVEIESFAGQDGDLLFNFQPPLETSRIRLNQLTTAPGDRNSVIYEWEVYESAGCMP